MSVECGDVKGDTPTLYQQSHVKFEIRGEEKRITPILNHINIWVDISREGRQGKYNHIY